MSNSITGSVPYDIDWGLSGGNYPLVSVVIPTYNRLAMLLEAIASVRAQTYTKWELIVADDGSTDNTAETIQRMGDPRIRLIGLPHTGHISNVRNAGVKTSKGEWLAFLDSDDLWMPQKLERQLETLKKEKKRWAYGLFEYRDENQKMIYKSPEKFAPFSGHVVKEIIMGKAGICICSLIVEKKLFDEIGGFSPHLEIKGDYEFVLRLALNAEAAITKEIILRVRDHPNRTYKSATYPHERSASVYQAFINLKPGKEFEKLARTHIAFLLSEASIHRFAKREYRVALRQLSQSLWMRDKPGHWLSALKRGIYAAYKKHFRHPAKKRKAENVAAYHS